MVATSAARYTARLLDPPSRTQLRCTAQAPAEATAKKRANAAKPRGSPANSSATIAHDTAMP